MATALPFAAFGTGCLASVAGFVATDCTAADMIGAGTFATGPTKSAARFTVLATTVWAGMQPTSLAENFLARLALYAARFTDNMFVAAEHER
jgi:hypothetical protein